MSKFIAALGLLATAVLAAPLECSGDIVVREGVNNQCGPPANNDPKLFLAQISYYNGPSCASEQFLKTSCLYANPSKRAAVVWHCFPSDAPTNSDKVFARLEDAGIYNEKGVEALFTNDQVCPPTPGATFAVLKKNNACVAINKTGAQPGVSIYPEGGSGLSKRGDVKCKNFNKKSQKDTTSGIKRVSETIDCTNGSDAGCSISVGAQHTESVTTTYSVTAGVAIEKIFNVGATFGQDYTESTTTTIQTTQTIQKGQKGYLSAYADATLFEGEFTECEDGQNHPGQVTAIKDHLTYQIVLTSRSA